MNSSTTSLSSSALKPRSQVPSSSEYALHGKIMLCTIVLLLVVAIIMVCFHSYEHCCFFKIHHRPPRRRRSSRPLRTHQLFSNPSAADSSGGVAPQQGLDVSILKALPIFIYSSKAHDQRLECAVCLSDFQEQEKGRVLPQCHHAFHVPCIDMWFHSHSNCPLCRAPVPQPPDPKPTETVVSVTVPAREEAGPCEQDKGYRDDEKDLPSSSQGECQQEISAGWRV